MTTFSPRLRKRYPVRKVHSGGFSLVELLIAITLGLLILVGVGSVFLGSKQSFRSQESLSQVQEAGRFSALLVIPHIRLAGYVSDPLQRSDPTTIFTDTYRAVWGIDDGDTSATLPTGISKLATSDLLEVRYTGQSVFGLPAPAPADESISPCGRRSISDTEMGVNIFYVDIDSSGKPNLYCHSEIRQANAPVNFAPGGVGTTQPFIAGITDFQVLYGVDTNEADDSPAPPAQPGLFPNRYVTAANVTDWRRVVAVKLDITSAGIDATEAGPEEARGASVTATANGGAAIRNVNEDRQLQRVFSSTVLIRNRLRE